MSVIEELRHDLNGSILEVKVFKDLMATNSEDFSKYIIKCYNENLDKIDTIVIDAEALEFIDSQGLNGLVYLKEHTDRWECALKIINVSPKIMKILSVFAIPDHIDTEESN